jgi:hypothetical protein
MGPNTTETTAVLLKTVAGRENKDTIELIHWTSSQRTMRALKMLGTFWGLALFSVFLPVLHFVLVPTFFLLGPIMAYGTYKQDAGIVAKDLVCPECGAVLKVSAQKMKWPLLLNCNNCKTRVYLHKA